MKICIIDYGAGNIKSIQFALERIGVTAKLTADADEIRSSDRVIFPGVGHAGSAMRQLKATGLDTLIPQLKQPVLGICLGMQLMCQYSEEGETEGLAIFEVPVKRFSTPLKVPQVGWNAVFELESDLFKGIDQYAYMYLVHSYYVPVNPYTIAKTTYGTTYTTALKKDNFYGVQFHPEKSGKLGQQLLENFINIIQ